eukprot:scaffold136466_cov24-Attheya_sp.AAC.1
MHRSAYEYAQDEKKVKKREECAMGVVNAWEIESVESSRRVGINAPIYLFFKKITQEQSRQ